MQQFLKDAGYTTNRPDGDYGRGTKRVVAAFQEANGLEATGIADTETIKMINKLSAEMRRAAMEENGQDESASSQEEASKQPATESPKQRPAKSQAPAQPEKTAPAKAQPAPAEAAPVEAEPAVPAGQASDEPSISLDKLIEITSNKQQTQE